jgi:hypothetical protein
MKSICISLRHKLPQPWQIAILQRRIFAGFWLETFQSFTGDLNESKSPLNHALSKVNMGPVFEVALTRFEDCSFLIYL